MTPLSLSCFLTASTRMFVDCLHIFRIVSGGKWIYPTEEETASAITSTTPATRSRLRVGIGNPSGAVYEFGGQAPSGLFSGGADRPRRRPHAAPRRVPALLPSILSPPPPSPHPQLGEAGGGERMLLSFAHTPTAWPCHGGTAFPAGWRAPRSGRQARTTVYPCGTSHGPKHLLPYTRRASGTPSREPTHRTNGAFTGSPGGTTAALADSPLRHASGCGHTSLTSQPHRFYPHRVRPSLTTARPPPWRDAAPSSPPAAASPSPGRLPAPPRAPRNATTRSAVSAPGPRFPPSALAYSRSRSAAGTTG